MNTSRYYTLCIVIVFYCFNSIAQSGPSQTSFKLFFEKVYVHTDRDVYMQNDTIWFKAYLVNAQNNTLIGTSGNLYVELITQDSAKLVNREIIRLDYGKGNGDFSLTDSIPSGKYTLRAYTNWMRNFGNNFIFEKDITIYNTLKKKTIAAVPFKESNTRSGNGSVEMLPLVSAVPLVRFYPEGGSLIEGVSSIIGVKACDVTGKGVAVNGVVLTTNGDTVTKFSCDTLGMGRFALLPIKRQIYHAAFNYLNRYYQVGVPVALTTGLALRISISDTLIYVLITNTDTSVIHNVILIGKHSGKMYFEKQISLINGQVMARIPKSLFPEGIAAITLYDDQNKPHCERLVYVHNSNNNPLTITIDKPGYNPKEKVTIHIKTNSDKANLSIAVVDAGVVPVQTENIESYLMLQSEIKGNIEHPERYFDTSNVNRFKQLDLLLTTQGWRDFVWRRLADSTLRISYKAENGIDITGKVRNEKNNKPLPGLNITLYASAEKGSKLFSNITDTAGRFAFTGLQYYGDNPVKLSATNSKGEKTGSFLMDTLALLPITSKRQYSSVDTSKVEMLLLAKKKQSELKKINFKSNNILKEVKIKASKSVILNDGIPLTTWDPDQVFDITPKDYQYKTLEWYLLQHVKGARQSTENGVTGVVIPGIDTNCHNCQPCIISKLIPPMFFINGVDYTSDINEIAENYRATYYPLPIDKFKKVIVQHLVTGFITRCGILDRFIIYLTLKEGALDGYNPGSLRPTVNGYYNARTFYKPIYDTHKDLNNSDNRTSIHWEPNIITDSKGEATVTYYNADSETNVRIVVEGLTKEGIPIVLSKTYLVK